MGTAQSDSAPWMGTDRHVSQCLCEKWGPQITSVFGMGEDIILLSSSGHLTKAPSFSLMVHHHKWTPPESQLPWLFALNVLEFVSTTWCGYTPEHHGMACYFPQHSSQIAGDCMCPLLAGSPLPRNSFRKSTQVPMKDQGYPCLVSILQGNRQWQQVMYSLIWQSRCTRQFAYLKEVPRNAGNVSLHALPVLAVVDS